MSELAIAFDLETLDQALALDRAGPAGRGPAEMSRAGRPAPRLPVLPGHRGRQIPNPARRNPLTSSLPWRSGQGNENGSAA